MNICMSTKAARLSNSTRKTSAEGYGNLDAALKGLFWLIAIAEYEYPDAEWTVSQQFGVSSTDLQAAYDKFCENDTSGKRAAAMFFDELLGSVETLAEIVDEHGSRTLSDLMYLQNAILNGSFIDHYPDESKVLEIASALPSGEHWSKFIKVDSLTPSR